MRLGWFGRRLQDFSQRLAEVNAAVADRSA